jgi:4-amino-4-deoxy-L-arabinose transferase-like glycosyltransferase
VAGWCGVLFLYGLSAGPLYRTESLRAVIGAECLRGHWLYPVLYGEPFLTKPPGHYAAIGLCSLPFGRVTEWSARLPSVVAATATVLLVTWLFRRSLGDRAGLLAAFLLPTSVLWLDKVPSAEIDMTLVGWVTASLVLFIRAIGSDARGADAPRSPGWLVASLLCLAAGTLTKWTAPPFFLLTVVPLLAWRGQLRLLVGWRFLLAVGVALAAVAGWAVAVSVQVGWDTLAGTVRAEAAYRFHPSPKATGDRWAGLVTYPLVVLAAHLPLSLFALRTLRPGVYRRESDRGRLLLQLLHCWTWPNLVFWSLVPNHSVRYVLPLGPGLMGLGVVGLLDWWRVWQTPPPAPPLVGEGRSNRSFVFLPSPTRGGVWLVSALALWLAVKVVFVEVVIPRRSVSRDAEPAAAQLRDLVPPGETLYVLKLKDEGVTFRYARPVRRARDPAALPRPGYAVLIEAEWRDRAAFGDVEAVRWMYDQQGGPIVLVRTR